MSDSIKLSPKHGVNPSVTICFWCGEDIGVALFGRLGREDKEAPRRVVTDYEPCDTCQAQWVQGFTFIEVDPVPRIENMAPIGHDDDDVPVYPTGRLVVIKTEAAARFLPPEMLGGANKVLVDIDGFERLQPEEVNDERFDSVPDEMHD